MNLITETQLKRYQTDSTIVRMAESHRKSAYTATTKVFLSHSHHDSDLVFAARLFLESYGTSIYVDTEDGEMPPQCSTLTATKIKQKIRTLKKFVLLASENSLSSRWVPWEVGFAESAKLSTDIAVLAFSRQGRDWTGNEYVGLLPIITADGRVERPGGGGGVSLSQWLS